MQLNKPHSLGRARSSCFSRGLLITHNQDGPEFTFFSFEAFLKNAYQKFRKLLMILDRAPHHRANVVLDAIKELDDQVRLAYLPTGCPDLNAIEELWMQMKMMVLSGPYLKLSKSAGSCLPLRQARIIAT